MHDVQLHRVNSEKIDRRNIGILFILLTVIVIVLGVSNIPFVRNFLSVVGISKDSLLQNLSIDKSSGGQDSLEAAVRLPSDFPKQFPLIQGAELTASLGNASKTQDANFWLTFIVKQSFEEVKKYYDAQFIANKWTIVQKLTMTDGVTYIVEKENLQGSLSLGRSPDNLQTTLVVLLGSRQNNDMLNLPIEKHQTDSTTDREGSM